MLEDTEREKAAIMDLPLGFRSYQDVEVVKCQSACHVGKIPTISDRLSVYYYAM
jgi:hypothetical protein